ncbi:MAG: hypothetical protein JXQ87_11250 [Bacteroidia bacterium]
MNKQELKISLETSGFFKSFEKMIDQPYGPIDYGARLKAKKFESLFDADLNYAYNGETRVDLFMGWHAVLNSEKSTNEDLLVACLEIFDWGGVLNSNVKKAVDLYKNGTLKSYLKHVSSLLKVEETLAEKKSSQNITWTSGWTKVYSIMNNDILIYDSRVSAFLNYCLTIDYEKFDSKQLSAFTDLSKWLYNFGGAPGRERKLDKKFGFKNQHPSGVKGFNANLIASWIVQLTNDELELQKNVRAFERSFFMLGFDLKQIKEN